jgi:general transcription factor 3C polypeptide 3 (transcription factor C subunit 4)
MESIVHSEAVETQESSIVTYEVEVDDNILNASVNEEAELGLLVDSIYTNEVENEPDVRTAYNPQHEALTGNTDGFTGTMPMNVDSADELSDSGSDLDINGDILEEAEARRINDLTQRYLTGKLSFSEFVRGTEADSGDKQTKDSDEDYVPYPSKRIVKEKDSSEAFCREFDATTSGRIVKKRNVSGARPKISRQRRTLPPVLSNLLGQANLKYAQNEKNVAVQICEEIIRQVPQDPGPYKLLALVYRDKGMLALAHHYSLIAAHLSPQSCDDWIQLAETSLELGEKDQALTCLTQAISSNRYNPDPRLRQIKLLQSIGESKAAQKARERMVETLSSSPAMTQKHGRLILLQAKIAAREFHQENNLPRATKIMECAITACKTSALQDDIHLLVELHCEQNENLKGLNILQQECNVVIEPLQPPFRSCYCPDTLAPDLRAKLIVFLVRLDIDSQILNKLLEPFLQGNPDDEGDLFLDIVEALMAKSRYEEAMLLLRPLVESEAFSRAAVWLTHGECLRHLSQTELAVKSYQNVMQLAPQHVQARLTLSSLLCQLEKFNDALDVLRSKDPEPRLLFEEFHLLCQSQTRKLEAVDVAINLLTQYIQIEKLKDMYESLTQRRSFIRFNNVVENGPTKTELYDIVYKATGICLKEKLFVKFKRLTFIAMYVKPLNDFRKSIELLCLFAAVHSKDSNLCWMLVRDVLLHYTDSTNAWNLFSVAVEFPEDSKHSRFVARLLSKNPANWASGICYANNCFIAGAYKDALVEYGSRQKVCPTPYTALMLGITWTHLACQKRQSEKQLLVLQAKAFFEEYARLRGDKCKQEIYYNLGRAMHQLSLMELAREYYHKALNCPPNSDNVKILDLTKEAAYNLAFMYKSSGNHVLARKIINDYIVI